MPKSAGPPISHLLVEPILDVHKSTCEAWSGGSRAAVCQTGIRNPRDSGIHSLLVEYYGDCAQIEECACRNHRFLRRSVGTSPWLPILAKRVLEDFSHVLLRLRLAEFARGVSTNTRQSSGFSPSKSPLKFHKRPPPQLSSLTCEDHWIRLPRVGNENAIRVTGGCYDGLELWSPPVQ